MQRTGTTQTSASQHHPITGSQRIYAQMRPSSHDTAAFTALQADLPKQSNGRMIGPEELHLTLIHFGAADDVYESLCRHTKIDRELFDEQLVRYITQTTALLPLCPMELVSDSFDLFGPNQTTLVARFRPTEALSELHAKLFGVLLEFFERLAVPDPLTFMQNDPNFRHALTCNPHVTLYKGYSGAAPHGRLQPVRFESMDVVY